MIIYLHSFDIDIMIITSFKVIIVTLSCCFDIPCLYHYGIVWEMILYTWTCVIVLSSIQIPVITVAGEAGGITPVYRRCHHWVEIECWHRKVLGIKQKVLEKYRVSFSQCIVFPLYCTTYFAMQDWFWGLYVEEKAWWTGCVKGASWW